MRHSKFTRRASPALVLPLCLLAGQVALAADASAPRAAACPALIAGNTGWDRLLEAVRPRFARPNAWDIRIGGLTPVDDARSVALLRAFDAHHPEWAFNLAASYDRRTGRLERLTIARDEPADADSTLDNALPPSHLGHELRDRARARAEEFWDLRDAGDVRLVRTYVRPRFHVIYVVYDVTGTIDDRRVTRPVVFVVRANRAVEPLF